MGAYFQSEVEVGPGLFQLQVGKVLCYFKKEGKDFAKVKWFLSPKSLHVADPDKIFSQNELLELKGVEEDFLSSKIKKRVYLYNFDDFWWEDTCTKEDPFIHFYTRASFNPRMSLDRALEPPYNSIGPKDCVCKRARNPDETYVMCETCQTWFHCKCVDILD